jgi:periplasmic divalent cation tolerance protein
MMATIYAIVMTTVGSKAEADRIARALLAQHLAACIQVTQIQSYYTWQDRLNIDDEHLLTIKCKQADFADIQSCIKINHSYEIPEIIQVPITTGLPDYLRWISEVTR